MAKHHPRPTEDFAVTSLAWELKNEEIHRRAGFPEVPREVIVRRFWQFLRFIQRQELTSRVVAQCLDDISECTELRNGDLTEAGFYFVQRFHGRWLSRVHKDKGEEDEESFLEKWYKKFEQSSG